MGEMIELQGPDGAFKAYFARPASTPAPGVVLIQEIFGVNAFMRKAADELAGRGYAVMVPDLFWRLQPGVELDATKEEEFQKGLDLMGEFDIDTGVKDIQTTITVLRADGACNGKVGAVGYCLGGLLAFLTAARTDSDASVGYYGVNIDKYLDEAKTIKAPFLLHQAVEDGFVPKEQQEKVIDGLSGNSVCTVERYPGRDHGFARSTDPNHYHEADAKTADARTMDLFQRHLA